MSVVCLFGCLPYLLRSSGSIHIKAHSEMPSVLDMDGNDLNSPQPVFVARLLT